MTPNAMFQLRMLQHRGQDLDVVWTWPMYMERVEFTSVMLVFSGVDDALLQQAMHCSLQCAGDPDHPTWWIVTNHTEVLCAINGIPLGLGQLQRLDHGDVIELGLSRFMVNLRGEPGLRETSAQLAQPADSANGSGVSASTMPLAPPPPELPGASTPFDLTDLAHGTGVPVLRDALSPGLHGGHKSDAFDDLIAAAPSEAGATASDKAMVAEQPVSRPPETSAQPSRKNPDTDAQRGLPLPNAPDPKKDSNDPLQILHAEYLKRLVDPAASDTSDLWQDVARAAAVANTDAWQHLKQSAGQQVHFDDLLGQSESIDDVLAGLDRVGDSNILSPESFDSVMHLFAPAHLQPPRPGTLDILQTLLPPVAVDLPGLTRREHHSLSLDSAMPGPSTAPRQAAAAEEASTTSPAF